MTGTISVIINGQKDVNLSGRHFIKNDAAQIIEKNNKKTLYKKCILLLGGLIKLLKIH